MSKIDWSKPIQSANTKKPARLLCTDRRGGSYPGKLPLDHAVLVVVEEGTSEVCVFVDADGSAFGAIIIENVPPTKIKVPYAAYKNSIGQVFIATNHHLNYIKRHGSDCTILSEGVLEVEDK